MGSSGCISRRLTSEHMGARLFHIRKQGRVSIGDAWAIMHNERSGCCGIPLTLPADRQLISDKGMELSECSFFGPRINSILP